MSYIPNGDYRGLAIFSGTYPPKWWKPLRTSLAWFGLFEVVRLVWGLF